MTSPFSYAVLIIAKPPLLVGWSLRKKNYTALHNFIFRDLLLALVQMDELYCRVRNTGKIWLWLSINPVTKILPSLHLGHRKNVDAMALTHDLKMRLKPDRIPDIISCPGYSYHGMLACFSRGFCQIKTDLGDWIPPVLYDFGLNGPMFPPFGSYFNSSYLSCYCTMKNGG